MSVYEIRVKGHLDPRWSEWFDRLRITNQPNGEALLSGYIADQAALHGVLAKVRDLNLQLISVTSVHTDHQESTGDGGAEECVPTPASYTHCPTPTASSQHRLKTVDALQPGWHGSVRSGHSKCSAHTKMLQNG